MTNFIKQLCRLPSENKLQVNYLFKTEISDDTPFSYWDLIRKCTLWGNSRDMNRQLAGFGLKQLFLHRAIRKTTNDKLLPHNILLKWRQTDSKEMRSTGKWDSIPGTLNLTSAFRKHVLFMVHTHVRKSVCMSPYVCAYTHACIMLPPTYIKCIWTFVCMCILHIHQTIHFYFKLLLQDRRKTLKDKWSCKGAGTLIYFEKSISTTWKPC